MDVPRTYLDYNATAPVHPEVVDAVAAALRITGNPSSVHAAGRAARAMVETAREKVAALVGAQAEAVTFTSGGTEANALALSPGENAGVLLVSSVEHPSVLAGGSYAAVEHIPVNGEGVVDLDWLALRLGREPAVSRVSVMAVNNETGVIEPVARIAEIVREAGATFHCDMVQAAGRIPIEGAVACADLVTLSAHKIGGPQGVGALIRLGDDRRMVEPIIRGGGQERSLRAGTENVAGIVGFGSAAGLALENLALSGDIARLRGWLEEGLRTISPATRVFSGGVPRVVNTTCFAVPGISAEKAVIALDLSGISVSSGAACSSGKVGPSHVLAAMGIDPHLAGGAIRVSLGRASTEADIERFLEAWRRVHGSMSQRGREEAA